MVTMRDPAIVVTHLREWARGTLPTVAATDLLIDSGFADPSWPWVRVEPSGRAWIDFRAIPSRVSGLSGGEQRLLLIAASLGGNTPVTLESALAGLDTEYTDLALRAIRAAAHTARANS